MGVFYVVEPLDDEGREWMSSQGVALPRGREGGRDPTPAEIREVCGSLTGFRVAYHVSAKKKVWQAAVVGINGPDRRRGTLLDIESWGGSGSATGSCSRRVTPRSSSESCTGCRPGAARWR
jgi:hypothetical protein